MYSTSLKQAEGQPLEMEFACATLNLQATWPLLASLQGQVCHLGPHAWSAFDDGANFVLRACSSKVDRRFHQSAETCGHLPVKGLLPPRVMQRCLSCKQLYVVESRQNQEDRKRAPNWCQQVKSWTESGTDSLLLANPCQSLGHLGSEFDCCKSLVPMDDENDRRSHGCCTLHQLCILQFRHLSFRGHQLVPWACALEIQLGLATCLIWSLAMLPQAQKAASEQEHERFGGLLHEA